MKLKIIAVSAIMLVVGVIQAQDSLVVEQAWVRETPPGAPNGAVYFNISNAGTADQLIDVSSAVADRAEMHTHIHQDGLMQMRQVNAIDVPANGHAVLKPHGDHVMLIGLKAPLKAGETVELQLKFKQGGKLVIQAPVRREPPEL